MLWREGEGLADWVVSWPEGRGSVEARVLELVRGSLSSGRHQIMSCDGEELRTRLVCSRRRRYGVDGGNLMQAKACSHLLNKIGSGLKKGRWPMAGAPGLGAHCLLGTLLFNFQAPWSSGSGSLASTSKSICRLADWQTSGKQLAGWGLGDNDSGCQGGNPHAPSLAGPPRCLTYTSGCVCLPTVG